MKKERIFWNILLTVLAVFVVGICIYQGVTKEQPVAEGDLDLPVLRLEDTYRNMDGRPEIFWALSEAELTDQNPWTEPEYKQNSEEEILFPVYRKKGQGTLPCEEELKEAGMTENERIPAAVMLDFSLEEENQKGRETLAVYLQDQQKDLMEEEYNRFAFCGLGFDTESGTNLYKAVFYREKEKEQDTLFQYCLNKTAVIFNDGGEILCVYQTDIKDMESLGNYPVIREENARQLLNEGRYFTNVPGDFPWEEEVIKGELVYRNDGSNILIPYYCFLIRLSDEQRKELEEGCEPEEEREVFGTFYVPAVRGEYLDNLSIWHET